jgi:hypothetical protein
MAWKTLCVAAGIVLTATFAGAQPDPKLTDVTGTWVVNLESHQLGLELKQEGTKVEGTLHAMGNQIPLIGTFIDRKLELKGDPDDPLPHGGTGAGPIVATMLDDGTLAGELSTNRGRAKWTGERFKKP